VGPAQAITACFKKYATFSGRASRAEFWWFFGLLVDVCLLFAAVGYLLDLQPVTASGAVNFTVMIVPMAIMLVLAIPFFAVSWRRLHDIGWPGWGLLIWAGLTVFFMRILLVVMSDLSACDGGGAHCFGSVAWGFGYTPFITIAVLWIGYFIAMTRPSSPDTNKFGPNPHEVTK